MEGQAVLSGEARKRIWRRRTLICILALAAALAAPSAALALSQRGHAFEFSLGATGEGRLSDPGAVAVSEATGEVYVLARGENRIEAFTPEVDAGRIVAYKFASAWGYGVENGANEYQRCETGCETGLAGTRKYEFNSKVLSIAVDNCTTSKDQPCTEEEDPSVGDVYVAAESGLEGEKEAIEKFSPAGEPLERITKIRYETEGSTESEELEPEEAHGLTVGPNGAVWLYYEESLYGLSDVKLGTRTTTPVLNVEIEGNPEFGLAVDGSGDFYVGHEDQLGRDVVAKETPEAGGDTQLEALIEGLNSEATVGLAVDQSVDPSDTSRGDVYLDAGSSVGAYSANGSEVQRLGEGEGEGNLQEGAGVAVDAKTDTILVADASAGRVDVYLPRTGAAPTVDDASASEITSESARLNAQIDTDGASATYYFEYGTTPCDSAPPVCVRAPEPAATIDGAYGDQGISVLLQEGTSAPVSVNTTYHYRVVVEDPHGGGTSAEGMFRTLPAGGESVADARTWEMVSPADMEGAAVKPLGTETGGVIQSSANGNAITYGAEAPFAEPEGNRSIEVTQILSSRDNEGWHSKDIVTPNSGGRGLKLGYHTQEYQFFSSDLSLALLTPFQSGTKLAEPPLSPPMSASEETLASEGTDYLEKTIYVRDDKPVGPRGEEASSEGTAVEPHGEAETALYRAAEKNGTAMHNPGYVPLVSGLDAPGVEFGLNGEGEENLTFIAATSNLSHIVLESYIPLASGAGKHGLYEWSGERGKESLEQVNLLEGGTPAEGAQLGVGSGQVEGRTLDHAISEGGERLFWTYRSHLYLRDTHTPPGDAVREETVQLDAVQTGASGSGTQDPVFQSASADGSRVFFTDEQQLTPGAGASSERPDLYVCELVEVEVTHKLACDVTDLTPPYETHERTESADIPDSAHHGGVLGTSEDGAYVYFAAGGVLSEAPNARGEAATPGFLCGRERPEGRCDLYVVHYDAEQHAWGAPEFIATVSGMDERDWAASGEEGNLSARVSPNGRYLAFMSERELTGYDNHDAASGAPDEEVFLYEATSQQGASGQLVCASCDPSGAQPAGVLDSAASTGGVGLLVDRRGEWKERWLAGSLPSWPGTAGYNSHALYENRVLSNSGRLFFDSPADLVPAATNGREDVYEYEPLGVPRGSHVCTSTSTTYDEGIDGCVGLISSGESTSESAFLDASEAGGEGAHGEELDEGGGDVFFVTAAKLVAQDTEGGFAAYDAHECTVAEPCISPASGATPTSCEEIESCRPSTHSTFSGGAPAIAAPSGSGNITPKRGVLGSKTAVKPLTRAQKLAQALQACRTAYHRSRRSARSSRTRVACEKAARQHYGPIAKKSANVAGDHAAGGRAR
jgi:hypothetical protein